MAKKIILTTTTNSTVTVRNNPDGTITTTTNPSSTTTGISSYVYTNAINHKINTSPSPFSLSFSWEGKTVNITLKNGNDVFKLANTFMEWLDKNEIEYNVKTSKKKK